jgi:hypothetical protein
MDFYSLKSHEYDKKPQLFFKQLIGEDPAKYCDTFKGAIESYIRDNKNLKNFLENFGINNIKREIKPHFKGMVLDEDIRSIISRFMDDIEKIKKLDKNHEVTKIKKILEKLLADISTCPVDNSSMTTKTDPITTLSVGQNFNYRTPVNFKDATDEDFEDEEPSNSNMMDSTVPITTLSVGENSNYRTPVNFKEVTDEDFEDEEPSIIPIRSEPGKITSTKTEDILWEKWYTLDPSVANAVRESWYRSGVPFTTKDIQLAMATWAKDNLIEWGKLNKNNKIIQEYVKNYILEWDKWKEILYEKSAELPPTASKIFQHMEEEERTISSLNKQFAALPGIALSPPKTEINVEKRDVNSLLPDPKKYKFFEKAIQEINQEIKTFWELEKLEDLSYNPYYKNFKGFAYDMAQRFAINKEWRKTHPDFNLDVAENIYNKEKKLKSRYQIQTNALGLKRGGTRRFKLSCGRKPNRKSTRKRKKTRRL